MSHPAKNPMRQAWLMVGLLWFVALLNYLDRMILITMRSSIKESIPMTDAQVGLLTKVFLIADGFCCPLGGFIADKFNCSRIITFSLFGWSAITWLTAHATSIYVGGVVRDAQVEITTMFNYGAAGLLTCAVLLWSVKPRPISSPET